MVRRDENLFHRGPVIRDLSVPEEEIVLRPASLRRRRRFGLWLKRLYGTALLAWTVGLALATSGFLHGQGARSGAVRPEGAAAIGSGEVIVPLPEPALPVWIGPVREGGPP